MTNPSYGLFPSWYIPLSLLRLLSIAIGPKPLTSGIGMGFEIQYSIRDISRGNHQDWNDGASGVMRRFVFEFWGSFSLALPCGHLETSLSSALPRAGSLTSAMVTFGASILKCVQQHLAKKMDTHKADTRLSIVRPLLRSSSSLLLRFSLRILM